MGYAVRNDGIYGCRSVAGPEDCMANETYSIEFVPYEKTEQEKIKEEIAELEAQQTPRRLREAALSADGLAWLQDLDNRIYALRNQMTQQG